jgi:hypothetical protein
MCAEGVMMDDNLRPGDIGAIFSITPTMHVKAVAECRAKLHVMPCFIAAPRSAVAGDGVTVKVEFVSLDKRRSDIKGNTVAQPLILAMVDEIVVDMVSVAFYQKNSGVTESGNLAVIDLQSRILHPNAS